MATMLLFIGSQSRRCPARSAVNPSRARRTYDARTVPCRGHGPGRLDPGHLRALVDGDAHGLDDVGEPPHQPGRVDAGRVRAPQRDAGAGDADAPVQLLLVQGHEVRRSPALVRQLRPPRQQPTLLGGVGGDVQDTVLDDVGLDALLRGDVDDLVHRREHLPLHADGRTPAVRGGVAAGLPGQLGGEPAAVATRGAEAGELLLQDRDAQVRLVTLEVVRRPQRGQAAADEGHVDVEVARAARAASRAARCRGTRTRPRRW